MVCLCLVFENNIVVVNAELYSFVCDDCRCHFQNDDDEAHLMMTTKPIYWREIITPSLCKDKSCSPF